MEHPDTPVATIVVGMAGAGKTTFMQRLTSHLNRRQHRPYVLNLDPAVLSLPYPANIDIRDTINYKQVMKQYSLGPNGGILTSLNLFTTKFDQVLQLLDSRAAERKMTHVLMDTPGQIEIFTWSASGAIITDSLASSFPTVLTYLIDSPRSVSCSTFISSMLYAVSILYKTKLPMIIVFNKTDVEPCETRVEWMRDFESFQAALRTEEEASVGGGSGYMSSLMNSMSLVLEEFYNHLDVVGVSALTGDGFDDYLACLERKRTEYWTEYRPELEAMKAQRDERREAAKKEQVEKLMRDMGGSSGGGSNVRDAGRQKVKVSDVEGDEDEDEGFAETVSDAEQDDDDDDEDDGELIEPDEVEDFETVESHPADPPSHASSSSRRTEVDDLAELMGGIGSLKQARMS
ncbi:protein of unknown function [Taphrina deformans PYCC 5710]|uniref:GPN-loop GTPase n=1 Tax=Taphrina deformans (strain PYCC 5710 / ATCC 11124 / CBS 356.35 / IMI 108563 / JCM 9778 / NBRC 8474) TaxID=1097556 RepID=R4XF62_TAPDE|nr:protein of unknown function [Taphrina deformans PYCC 5710]|eukprot:CCG84288.1 protein of unknown function [Taphrina deformans PYCC 5710]